MQLIGTGIPECCRHRNRSSDGLRRNPATTTPISMNVQFIPRPIRAARLYAARYPPNDKE
jgi:hypothetical protein